MVALWIRELRGFEDWEELMEGGGSRGLFSFFPVDLLARPREEEQDGAWIGRCE